MFYRRVLVLSFSEIFGVILPEFEEPKLKGTSAEIFEEKRLEVVLLVLDLHACIAGDAPQFSQLVVLLMHEFRIDHSLLEKRGALIICRLCVLLDAERVYRELSRILEGESDLDFASIMVQALNLILLTSSELNDLRTLLKQSLANPTGKDLFLSLYASWCHSPTAVLSLCLLAQAYLQASSVIHLLVEEDINVKFLVQLDRLIRLLETPTFSYLRLQLLEPEKYIWLLRALYGLLMLLPQQSAAFKTLWTRLKAVPSRLSDGQLSSTSSGNVHEGINLKSMLQQFEHLQHQHRMLHKSKLVSRSSIFSTSQSLCMSASNASTPIL